jgi:hypothetical protein
MVNDKYIYLVFSKTGTWLSNIIAAFSDTKYVHASLSCDDSFRKMYSFGRKKPNNPFTGGLAIENLYSGVYRKSPFSECLIYKVKVTEEQYSTLTRELESFLIERDKYKYNFLGLFAAFMKKPYKRKYYYFCSQFVSELLIKSNIYKTDKVPELIEAKDLMNMENNELIYKGYINKYSVAQEAYPLGSSFTAG